VPGSHFSRTAFRFSLCGMVPRLSASPVSRTLRGNSVVFVGKVSPWTYVYPGQPYPHIGRRPFPARLFGILVSPGKGVRMTLLTKNMYRILYMLFMDHPSWVRARSMDHGPRTLLDGGGGFARLQLLAGQIQRFEIRRLVPGHGLRRGRVVERREHVRDVAVLGGGRGRGLALGLGQGRRREPGVVGRLAEILRNHVQPVLLEMAAVHPVRRHARPPKLGRVVLPVLAVHDGFRGPGRHQRPPVLHERGERLLVPYPSLEAGSVSLM
jgi:hypothetical protein